jgi:DNA-binding sugar fermentation-stimulating protein
MKLTLIESKIINKPSQTNISPYLVDIQINKEIVLAYNSICNDYIKKDINVKVSYCDNINRKSKYTLEMIKINDKWIGINLMNVNKLFIECIENSLLEDFKYYKIEQSDVKLSNFKLDFSLHNNYEKMYVNIDGIYLIEIINHKTVAIFNSERIQKQIDNSIKLKNEGYNIVLVFIVQQEDVDFFYCEKVEEFDFIYCYKFKCLKNSIKFLEKLDNSPLHFSAEKYIYK